MKNPVQKLVLHYTGNSYHHKKVRLVLVSVLITAGFSFFYAMLSVLISFNQGKVAMIIQGIIFLCIFPLLFWFRVPLLLIGNLFILIGFSSEYFITFYTGGLHSPVLPWLVSVPIAALLLTNRWWAWVWGTIVIFSMVLLHQLQHSGLDFLYSYNREHELVFYAACYGGLALICLSLNQVFEHNLNRANEKLEISNKQLAEEREVSENLLLNILPYAIAQELKINGKASAHHFKTVTVLFADVKEFTKMVEKMTADQLVYELDVIYSAFDNIVEKYNVEKIKTVGDAYICASGLPVPSSDHACRVLNAAVEMQQFIIRHKRENILEGLPFFEMRIGIHSGPVVAGVVGIKKFAYDIWGDTVNTAARMEENSEPGKINISQSTYELTRDFCKCTYRGKILVKNKGEIDMYFVEGLVE